MLYRNIRCCLALALLVASHTNSEVSARVRGAVQRLRVRIRGNGHIDSGFIHRVGSFMYLRHPPNFPLFLKLLQRLQYFRTSHPCKQIEDRQTKMTERFFGFLRIHSTYFHQNFAPAGFFHTSIPYIFVCDEQVIKILKKTSAYQCHRVLLSS